jgi:hypothetical protein
MVSSCSARRLPTRRAFAPCFDTPQRRHRLAGVRGLELANAVFRKPLKYQANTHRVRSVLGAETFRVRAAM